MAIAFGTAVHGGNGVNITVGTLANGIGIASIANSNTATNVTMTWGGVAMTLIDNGGLWNSSAFTCLTFYILNPPSGATAVNYSGGAGGNGISAATYSGVNQDTPIDAFTHLNNTAGGSLSKAIITIADNCWVVASGSDLSGNNASNGTNYVNRVSAGDFLGDNNAVVHPAGSLTVAPASLGGASDVMMLVSLMPAPVPNLKITESGIIIPQLILI